MMRRIFAATAAGVAAALVVGVVMTAYFRALMALIAEADAFKDAPHFSLEGTASIAVIVVAFGVPGSIALAALRRRRWIGYALVAAGCWTHVVMLIQQLPGIDLEGDLDRTAALIVGYAAYVLALVVYVRCTGWLARGLRRGFRSQPVPSPAGA
jgi:hypothetical protein